MSVEVMSVPEISCDACKRAIEGALTPLSGVSSAVVDVAARRVRVDYDESRISSAGLVTAIEAQGFAVADHNPAER